MMILATIDVTFVCVTTRDNLSTGSWNIQEEIHRVRTKATKDILSSHRSIKHTPSTLEYNTTKIYLLNDNYVVMGRDDAINFGTPKPVTEIVTLDLDEGTLGLLANALGFRAKTSSKDTVVASSRQLFTIWRKQLHLEG
ncbi:hypothetical protein Tco_0345028 [Tanacetum coccineum]